MNPLRPALTLLVLLTLITGLFYPLFTTLIAHGLFPEQAKGSLLRINGEIRGSTLIGQAFYQAAYFHGRPSATLNMPYNPLVSGGSNLAANNPQLDQRVKRDVAQLSVANPHAEGPIPITLVTASASGLDPHISPEAALWQAPRVAEARNIPLYQVENLIEQHTRHPFPYFLGESVVNVVELNLDLDKVNIPQETRHD